MHLQAYLMTAPLVLLLALQSPRCMNLTCCGWRFGQQHQRLWWFGYNVLPLL
jgi:hypothetical protein